ncbi:Arm DNA-binding domain-containing protein, partial [Turicimonas muris]
MPRLANAFTDIQLRHLKKEGITALGGVQGLCVRVENGRKTFIFRYTFQKKKREVTIGSYPVVSLSEAREKAMAYRKLLSEDVDPKEWRDRQREEKIENERRKELAELKFSTVADRYLAHRDTFSPFPIKERDLFLSRLGNYILPQIGSKTLETITSSNVADIL